MKRKTKADLSTEVLLRLEKVYLTYLRGSEVAELTEEDMPQV
jgi:hypothetical protein